MVTEVIVRWSTWEELLLGGAVLRHGTRDWNVVAAELRARSVCPYAFTSEVCKAKYEDLQQRFSGSTDWFEELKKTRVAELKKALEVSEDSIGSLQSKLEFLKGEKKNKKKDDCENDLESPVSNVPHFKKKLERVESSTKETSLSAGSFIHESKVVPAADENETKPEFSQSAEVNVLTVDNLLHKSCKKQRGKRKRKDCRRNIKEVASIEENSGDHAVSWCKEISSTSKCGDGGEVAKSSAQHVDDNDQNKNSKKEKHSVEDMIEILDSILETKGASAFRRRLDSQKRGRYKKMIRQHMDFDTIRSRISSQTIKSTVELFRDLLLLTNNALVFYSKTTREYKTAFLLRDIVTKKMRESFKDNDVSSRKVTHFNESIKLPVHNIHVKPRSVRPGNRKIIAKAIGGGNNNSSASGMTQGAKKPIKADSSPSLESLKLNVTKKDFGRRRKIEPVSSSQKTTTPVKGKKRVRTKS